MTHEEARGVLSLAVHLAVPGATATLLTAARVPTPTARAWREELERSDLSAEDALAGVRELARTMTTGWVTLAHVLQAGRVARLHRHRAEHDARLRLSAPKSDAADRGANVLAARVVFHEVRMLRRSCGEVMSDAECERIFRGAKMMPREALVELVERLEREDNAPGAQLGAKIFGGAK